MFRNLDEFSAALGAVVTEATTKAAQTNRVQQVVQAHASGNHAEAARIANSMTTAELKAAEKQLKK